MRRQAIVLVLALALAACQGQPPTTTGTPGPDGRTGGGSAGGGQVPAASAQPSIAPAGPSTAPPSPLVARTAAPTLAPIVGTQAARLAGSLRLPATLISDNAAAIVANNGGGVLSDWGAGIVSNNGGSVLSDWGAGMIGKTKFYRLRALPAQAPVAGARVTLRDGAGRPVVDAQGQPLVATTDAEGRWAIDGKLPAGKLVAIADLPGSAGQALGFVPDAGDARQADLDLVSTLTTGFVLHAYVKTQADKAATLAKLPAAIEAETRRKAEAALAAGEDAVPTRLTTEAVTASVGALRARDAAFDAQLEAVRRLLIPAGAFALGEGQPAVGTVLGAIFGVVPLPGGELAINCGGDGRIWRLGADGQLAVIAGRAGAVPDPEPAGKRAAEVTLGTIKHLTSDPAGRLVFVELGATDWSGAAPVIAPDRAWRIELDGTLTPLARGQDGIALFEPIDAERFVMVTSRWTGDPLRGPATWDPFEAQAWSVVPGAEPRLLHTFPAEDAKLLAFENRITFKNQARPAGKRGGRDARGRIYVEHVDAGVRSVHRFDPAQGFARTKVEALPGAALHFVDAEGDVLAPRLEGDRLAGLAVVPALADAPQAIAGALPAGVREPAGAAYGPGETAWVFGDGQIHRLAGGQAVRVAGFAEADAKTAADLALPARVAALPGGGFAVGDPGLRRVVRFDGAGAAAIAAGAGSATPGELPAYGVRDDQALPLHAADGAGAGALAADAAGTLYVGRGRAIWRIGSDGKPALHHAAAGPAGNDTNQFVARPGGALVFLDTARPVGTDGSSSPTDHAGVPLVEIPAGGGTPKVLAPQVPNGSLALALGPDGAVWLMATGTLHKWTEAGGLQQVAADARFGPEWSADIAVDARGRVYWSDLVRIQRFDPATGAFELLAGPGGRHFAGGGVDDGLARPKGVALAANGDLLIVDRGHRQIKRIPAAQL